jgi:hypothetical protein
MLATRGVFVGKHTHLPAPNPYGRGAMRIISDDVI